MDGNVDKTFIQKAGGIYIPRNWRDAPAFSSNRGQYLYLIITWLITFAEYEDKTKKIDGNVFELKRGQWGGTYSTLSKCLNDDFDSTSLKISLDNLVKLQLIELKESYKRLIITICNYDYYVDPFKYLKGHSNIEPKSKIFENIPLIEPYYISVKEAACLLHVNPMTVYKQLKKGNLHGRKLGSKWLVKYKDIF